jgi:hypothetical protein
MYLFWNYMVLMYRILFSDRPSNDALDKERADHDDDAILSYADLSSK